MMLWRRATFVLLTSLVGVCAWIYARDMGPYTPQGSERSRAWRDAGVILQMMEPSHACAGRCTAELIDRTAPNLWRMRLAAADWQRCFVLSVNTFAATEERGLTGLRSVACG